MRSMFESSVSDRDYPKLMASDSGNGLIVLFYDDKRGVVVHPGYTCYVVGSFADNWAMDEFSDFHGKVTLIED